MFICLTDPCQNIDIIVFHLYSVVWEQSNIQPAQSVPSHSNDHFVTNNERKPKDNHITCPELDGLEKYHQ